MQSVIKLSRLAIAGLLFFGLTGPVCAVAQDGRGTVAEPTIPAVCSVVTANMNVTAANEPSGEVTTTGSLVTAPDTSRIQSALSSAVSSCGTGKAVELSASGTNNAFLTGPIYVPSNVTLLIDGGVTVFASRNAADYQVGTVSSSQDQCGTVGPNGNGCYPLISMGQSSLAGTSGNGQNSNLMGYGVIEGRGGDEIILNGTLQTGTNTWWDIANAARSGGSQNNPILVQYYKLGASSGTTPSSMYKITLRNSPMFHVKNNYSQNWTVWGAKVTAPWTARNTDGVDPGGTTNVTIANSVIGTGDDSVAIGGSSASTGTSITNLLLVSGHGISIGSYTGAGVSNVLANGLYFQGQAADSNEGGLHIKSANDRGGLVQNIKYENACIQNVRQPIQLDPLYNTNSGTSYPDYKNITYANVHVLASTGQAATPYIELSGNSTYPAMVTLDNVVFDTTPAYSPAWQYAQITFSNAISGTPSAVVSPSNLTTNMGTGVSYTNSATISNAYALSCTGKYPLLVGELYGSTGASNYPYPNSLSVTVPASVTLNAMVQPTNTQVTFAYTNSETTYTNSATAAKALTGTVSFYEGMNPVGTGTLSANGTLATATITNPIAGTHTYTAVYGSDTNYPAGLTFGSLTVTVSAGQASQLVFATAPSSSLVYGNSPGTVTVTAKDAAGDAVTTLSGTVTLTVTGPNSYSATYTATASGGTATFSSIAHPPSVGTYNYTATQGSLTSAGASEAVSAAALTVTVNAASRVFDAPDPSYTDTITGYVNGDTSGVVSGAPAITSSDVRTSPAGTYPTTATLGTLSAANYVFTLVGSTLMVNGGAPQAILFAPLPNFASGNSYQLAARSTSGIPVTYTASGNATISGTTLNVTAPGPVTVTASSAGNTNYAAASSVTQSFTAQ